MLDYALELARSYGHEEVVVNAFHLAEQVVAWAEGKAGVRVVVERPVILGTGGGLKNAAEYLAERFVVLNGDILCDVDLGALYREDAPAVMAIRRQETPRFTGIGWRDEGAGRGAVTGIAGVVGEGDPGWHFTGVHVLNREELARVPSGEQCVIRTVYKGLVAEGKVRAVVHTGGWVDIGTLEDYKTAEAQSGK
jgi:NDP-sugar pyrophosphorylase family protein